MNTKLIHLAFILVSFAAGMGTQALADSNSTGNGNTAAHAQHEGQGPGGGGRRHGPPPEAIDACQGKASGATCSFTDREGESLTGTCFAPPARANASGQASGQNATEARTPPLACRPARGPREAGNGPDGQAQPGGQE